MKYIEKFRRLCFSLSLICLVIVAVWFGAQVWGAPAVLDTWGYPTFFPLPNELCGLYFWSLGFLFLAPVGIRVRILIIACFLLNLIPQYRPVLIVIPPLGFLALYGAFREQHRNLSKTYLLAGAAYFGIFFFSESMAGLIVVCCGSALLGSLGILLQSMARELELFLDWYLAWRSQERTRLVLSSIQQGALVAGLLGLVAIALVGCYFVVSVVLGFRWRHVEWEPEFIWKGLIVPLLALLIAAPTRGCRWLLAIPIAMLLVSYTSESRLLGDRDFYESWGLLCGCLIPLIVGEALRSFARDRWSRSAPQFHKAGIAFAVGVGSLFLHWIW